MSPKPAPERFRKIFLYSLLNQVMIFGLQFASSIFVVKALEIHAYATYILFNTTLNLGANLTNMGLRTYLTRFVPGSSQEKGSLILWAVLADQAVAILPVLAAGVPLLLIFRGSWLDKVQIEHLGLYILLFSILLFTSFPPRQFAGYFRYQSGSHKEANRIQLVSGVAYPVVVLLSVLIYKTFSLTYALGAMVLAQTATMIYVSILAKREIPSFSLKGLALEMRAAFVYSWPFALLPVGTQLIEVGNRYFLAGYKTPLELASFSFNYGICSAASNLISTSMGYTFFPMAIGLFNKGEIQKGKRLNFQGVLICSALTALFFFSYNFLSHPFLRFIGREKFILPMLPLMLISLSFLLQSLMQHPNFLMQVYNIRLSNVAITLSGTAVSLLLNFFLIRKYSVTGAALALCLTSAYLLAMNILPVLKPPKEPKPA